MSALPPKADIKRGGSLCPLSARSGCEQPQQNSACYNRFVRWRRAGEWAWIMRALAGAHDTAVQMIDTSIIRVHQHGA
jgi:transposase